MGQHVAHRHSDEMHALHSEIERLREENVDLLAERVESARLKLDIETYVRLNGELVAEIGRLTAALQAIVKRYDNAADGWPLEDMREIARRAIEPLELAR